MDSKIKKEVLANREAYDLANGRVVVDNPNENLGKDMEGEGPSKVKLHVMTD